MYFSTLSWAALGETPGTAILVVNCSVMHWVATRSTELMGELKATPLHFCHQWLAIAAMLGHRVPNKKTAFQVAWTWNAAR
jgi:hypothetical protein